MIDPEDFCAKRDFRFRIALITDRSNVMPHKKVEPYYDSAALLIFLYTYFNTNLMRAVSFISCNSWRFVIEYVYRRGILTAGMRGCALFCVPET